LIQDQVAIRHALPVAAIGPVTAVNLGLAWQQDEARVRQFKVQAYPELAAQVAAEGGGTGFAEEAGVCAGHRPGTIGLRKAKPRRSTPRAPASVSI